jgi:hypothetical protein
MAERVRKPVMSMFGIDRLRKATLLADETEEPVGSADKSTHAPISKIWPH